jgi:hypothetical protein
MELLQLHVLYSVELLFLIHNYKHGDGAKFEVMSDKFNV